MKAVCQFFRARKIWQVCYSCSCGAGGGSEPYIFGFGFYTSLFLYFTAILSPNCSDGKQQKACMHVDEYNMKMLFIFRDSCFFVLRLQK